MDRLSATDLNELAELFPCGIQRHVDLSAISQWRIGGYADLVVQPESTDQVAKLMQWFGQRNIKPVVIGLTSNLLFDDAGLQVPCIQIGPRMGQLWIDRSDVHAGAGIWVPALSRRLMQVGLGGAEHICGIPGTLGGLICMNGGSQRKGIGSAVVTVESVDQAGVIHRHSALECAFEYRDSIFQTNGEIITGCHLNFVPRPISEIRAEMRAILEDRRRKFPRKEPNCGSVFKSNPAMYAEYGPPGALIEQLGFKGMKHGDALVSPRHANFIINTGRASAKDVLTLISRISDAVVAATGYRMEAEAIFVRADGRLRPVCAAQNEYG
jgi:UDP-N-acetylmuramate dehydrogenase